MENIKLKISKAHGRLTSGSYHFNILAIAFSENTFSVFILGYYFGFTKQNTDDN